jgi:hypothetical protein
MFTFIKAYSKARKMRKDDEIKTEANVIGLFNKALFYAKKNKEKCISVRFYSTNISIKTMVSNRPKFLIGTIFLELNFSQIFSIQRFLRNF